MNHKILYITLRRLIGERDVLALQHLLAMQGAALFARALGLGSPRIIADALSLLPIQDRVRVLRHLPADLRDTMKPLCIGGRQRLYVHHVQATCAELRVQPA